MKKIVLLIVNVLLLTSIFVYGEVTYPEASKEFYINDFANSIDDEIEENIRKVNLNYENTKEKPQIVVVTVLNMQGLDENTYSVELFEKWGIGNKEYDNGVLVLLATEERRIKIEVGYGLEGAITDSEAGRILDSSLDYLSAGNYSKGIENIFYQLALQVNEEYNYDNDTIFGDINVQVQNQSSPINSVAIGKIIVLIILLILFGGFGGGGRGRRRRSYFIPPPIHRIGGFGGGFGGHGGGGGSFGGGGRSGGGGAGRGF